VVSKSKPASTKSLRIIVSPFRLRFKLPARSGFLAVSPELRRESRTNTLLICISFLLIPRFVPRYPNHVDAPIHVVIAFILMAASMVFRFAIPASVSRGVHLRRRRTEAHGGRVCATLGASKSAALIFLMLFAGSEDP